VKLLYSVTLAHAPTTGAVGPPSAVIAAAKPLAALTASTQQRKQQGKSANISTSQSQPLLRQTAAAVSAQEALPIFRKGFPGKKSLRAEVTQSLTLFPMIYHREFLIF
jgi:hypothetical protein